MDLTPKQRRNYHTDIMGFVIYLGLFVLWLFIILAFSERFRGVVHWAVLMPIWLFGSMAWLMMMGLVLGKFGEWRGR